MSYAYLFKYIIIGDTGMYIILMRNLDFNVSEMFYVCCLRMLKITLSASHKMLTIVIVCCC